MAGKNSKESRLNKMIPEKDLKILSELRKNSRTSLVEISRKTQIPVSTIYDRIKVREKDIIKKHTSLLDFPKLGYNIRTKILVKTKKIDEFQNFILKCPQINSVFKLNSNYNFLVDCIFMYMSEMEEFTKRLADYTYKQEIHFVSEELVRESFFTNQNNTMVRK